MSVVKETKFLEDGTAKEQVNKLGTCAMLTATL
jgi:hypothetical protein